MKTSSPKRATRFSWGRYILIVGAALILAMSLYAVLNVTDSKGGSDTDTPNVTDATNENLIGILPASFQEIREFREGAVQRLRLSGKAEPGAVVVITDRGERLRQVGVNDLGQWGATLEVEPKDGMALETQLYFGEGVPGIRSEETLFRIPIPAADTAENADLETNSETASTYKTPGLIMVTAPGSPSRVIQSPFGGTPTSGPLSLHVIDYDLSGGVIISGMSTVPGRVRFSAQNAVIGETGIGVGGRWSFIAGRMLPRSRIMLKAELIPAPGAPNAPSDPVSVTVPFNFLPPLQEEDTDGSGALFVNIDSLQWQIRRTLIGGGGQSTIIFAPEIFDEITQ